MLVPQQSLGVLDPACQIADIALELTDVVEQGHAYARVLRVPKGFEAGNIALYLREL